MKNHSFLALGAYALSLCLVPVAAHADEPPPAVPKPPDGMPGKPDGKPGGLGKPDGKPGDHAPRGEARSDKGPKGEHGEHGKPGADVAKPGEGPKLGGRGGPGFGGGMRQLHEELKAGKLTKAELKDKLVKLRESAGERGKLHRRELGKRWGGTLALPSAREELKQHARRMAFLDRALVLAETEAKDKDKDKLTTRISKLIEKENERHERALERLKSAPPAASGAPAASTAPAAAAPAASAEGAGK